MHSLCIYLVYDKYSNPPKILGYFTHAQKVSTRPLFGKEKPRGEANTYMYIPLHFHRLHHLRCQLTLLQTVDKKYRVLTSVTNTAEKQQYTFESPETSNVSVQMFQPHS